MLSKFKRNKHQQHLAQLPKISQSVDDVDFFYAPADFRETLLEKIASAKQRICIVALYLEQDDGGKGILNALYEAKRQRPELDVRVLVDWHRAQRGRIGAAASNTNADWYCRMAQENPGVDVPVYGVPINTREALGVLHFKGFIIDDSVLYSGASLNDVYLHQHDKYRYDRYHLIRNRKMSDIMFEWVTQNIMNGRGVNRLDDVNRPKSPEIKNDIRLFRGSCVMPLIISGRCRQRSAFCNAASGAGEIESVEQDHFPSYALCRAETNHLYAILQPASNPCAQYYPVAARREKGRNYCW